MVTREQTFFAVCGFGKNSSYLYTMIWDKMKQELLMGHSLSLFGSRAKAEEVICKSEAKKGGGNFDFIIRPANVVIELSQSEAERKAYEAEMRRIRLLPYIE